MGAARVKTAIIRTGFTDRVHLEAVRRLGVAEIVAVAGSSDAKARTLADSFGIERATGDYRTILANPDIDALHTYTPNARQELRSII